MEKWEKGRDLLGCGNVEKLGADCGGFRGGRWAKWGIYWGLNWWGFEGGFWGLLFCSQCLKRLPIDL